MKRRGYLVGLLFSMASLALVGSSIVGAYGDTFYNTSDGIAGSPKPEIMGAVGYTQWVKKSELNVGIYFTSSSGQVTIKGYSYCPGLDKSPFSDGYSGGGGKGSKITNYEFDGGLGSKISGLDQGNNKRTGVVYGEKNTNCTGSNGNKVIKFANLAYNSDIKMYVATLKVKPYSDNLSGNIQNTFQLVASGPGATIAHLGDTAKNGAAANGYAVTLTQTNTTPKYNDYRIKFGADCSIKPNYNGGRVSIRLYDLDNTKGSAQGNGKLITMKLQEKDRDGSWSNVALYKQDTGGAQWTGGGFFTPPGGNNKDFSVWFLPKAGKIYQLNLNDVYYGNAIQYNTPFDGIYADQGCPWSAKPTSVVKVNNVVKATVASATTADKIDWVHTITSNGKYATTYDVDYRVYRKIDSGSQVMTLSNTWTKSRLPGVSKTITTPQLTAAQKASYAGHTVCERLWINPSAYNPPLQGAVYSTWQCVKISNAPGAPAATTTAYVDGSAATYAHPGQSITFTHEITSGVAYAIDGVVGAGSSPDSTWRGVWDATTSDSQLDLGRPTTFHKGPGTTPYSNDSSAFVPTNADVGKQVCRQVEATHTVAGVTTRITSAGACVTIVPSPVSPTVQFWGYDARIGGVATTTSMIKDSKTYGSWSEYGAMMNGTNTGDLFASGAAYENGVTTAPSLSDKSALSFANTGAGNPSTGNWNGPIGFDGSYASLCPALSQTAINGISNATSTQVICNTGGTIEIKDDITLDSSVKATSNVPQILIIAKNIKIDSGVKRIDAWLIAGAPSDFDITSTDTDGGAINTCSEDATLNADGTFKAFGDISDASWQDGTDACKNPLIVNGPVMANKVYFNRTTDPTAAGAGEVFNLRGDAFLWAFGGGGGMNGKGVAQTVSVKELPPRF